MVALSHLDLTSALTAAVAILHEVQGGAVMLAGLVMVYILGEQSAQCCLKGFEGHIALHAQEQWQQQATATTTATATTVLHYSLGNS